LNKELNELLGIETDHPRDDISINGTSNMTPTSTHTSSRPTTPTPTPTHPLPSLSSEQQQQRQLTHVDSTGRATMVNVGHKPATSRTATAGAKVFLGLDVFTLVQQNKLKKGDVMTIAQLAGIMAAKQTANLIPLCHPIPLTKIDVNLTLDESNHGIDIAAVACTVGQTGVEMEALTAASVAALTVYDMCKAASKGVVISDIKLLSKSGGKSGDYDYRSREEHEGGGNGKGVC
jgi:molybdenum cofactor biosynthesis protein MoaC